MLSIRSLLVILVSTCQTPVPSSWQHLLAFSLVSVVCVQPCYIIWLPSTAASVVSVTVTSQCSQKPKVSSTTQTELTWPQGADTPVPVKTNSQATQTNSNQNSAKNTGIPPLLLLHQEVAEVHMLQYPLPVKAVRGTLNPHHLQKRMANQK